MKVETQRTQKTGESTPLFPQSARHKNRSYRTFPANAFLRKEIEKEYFVGGQGTEQMKYLATKQHVVAYINSRPRAQRGVVLRELTATANETIGCERTFCVARIGAKLLVAALAVGFVAVGILFHAPLLTAIGGILLFTALSFLIQELQKQRAAPIDFFVQAPTEVVAVSEKALRAVHDGRIGFKVSS